MRLLLKLITIASIVFIGIIIYNTSSTANRKNEISYNDKNDHHYNDKSVLYNGKYVPDTKKYIIYECRGICGGLGDRMKGIMDTYMWALLTNRRFLINMKKPCDLRNLLSPNTIEWNKNVYSRSIVYLNYIDSVDFKKGMASFDLLEFHKNVEIIKVEINYDWLYYMSKNERLQERIKELGFILNDFKASLLFHEIYNNLFKLSDHLLVKYNEFLRRAKPTPSSKLICIQVRIGGKRPNVDADFQFTALNNSLLYWDYVKQNIISQMNTNDYKIFITSDTESVEKDCISYFGQDRVVSIDGVFAHIDRENYGVHSCKRIEKVFLDFHALRECDEALVSRSGFGRLGVMNRPNSKTFKMHLFDYRTSKIEPKFGSDFDDMTQ